jgi:HTH-type transcriptional regulator/antitoxin HigA
MESRYKVIKTEAEYHAALARFEELLDMDESERDEDEIELLSILIEKYEDIHYPIEPPDPVDAIKFRMEQADLKPKDLIPYIGSRSKVSEVLSGKRELTLKMIRALHQWLGIPLESLVREPREKLPQTIGNLDFSKFPLSDMEKNGAFKGFDTKGRKLAEVREEAIRWLIADAGGFSRLPAIALRKTDTMRLNAKFNHYALLGWSMQVLREARQLDIEANFEPGTLDEAFFTSLVSLSVYEDGPRRVRELLASVGITLIAVPHLPRTYLDGAVFWPDKANPIVALTLRYDRIDNFWFVLLHELGHLKLGHVNASRNWIADDLELPAARSGQEKEADDFAAATLLPPEFDLHTREKLTKMQILEYAELHHVHPAIVSGRIRFLRKDFRTFSRILGHGQVRKLFSEFYPEHVPGLE